MLVHLYQLMNDSRSDRASETSFLHMSIVVKPPAILMNTTFRTAERFKSGLQDKLVGLLMYRRALRAFIIV